MTLSRTHWFEELFKWYASSKTWYRSSLLRIAYSNLNFSGDRTRTTSQTSDYSTYATNTRTATLSRRRRLMSGLRTSCSLWACSCRWKFPKVARSPVSQWENDWGECIRILWAHWYVWLRSCGVGWCTAHCTLYIRIIGRNRLTGNREKGLRLYLKPSHEILS